MTKFAPRGAEGGRSYWAILPAVLFVVGLVAYWELLAKRGADGPAVFLPVPVVFAACLTLFLSARRPPRLTMGAEGVCLKHNFRERTLLFRDVAELHLFPSAELIMKNGESWTFALSGLEASELLARFEAAQEPRAGADRATVVAMLEQRSVGSPLERVRALRSDVSASSYRHPLTTRETLLALAEDPTADPVHRTAAVVALGTSTTEEERRRVRVASEECASPKLRIALIESLDEDAETAARALDVGG